MTEDTFWELIDQSRAETEGNAEGQVWELESLLLKREADDAIAFVKHLQRILANSFTAPLWEVSYLINLDDREDTFEFFRAWMLLQGKEAFELIQENPDAIIDYIDEREVKKDSKLQSPELLSIGFSVWEELTGNFPEDMPLDRLEVELSAEPNLEEAHLEEEYPLLWDMFG
jgi:hypothetical protein